MSERRRATDEGWMCQIALRASQGWDWIDRRAVDKHFVTMAILYGTIKITAWAMHFATHGDRPGIEVAAIIGAVGAPYMALQAAAVKWYFEARK